MLTSLRTSFILFRLTKKRTSCVPVFLSRMTIKRTSCEPWFLFRLTSKWTSCARSSFQIDQLEDELYQNICPGWPARGWAIPEYLSRLTGSRTSYTRISVQVDRLEDELYQNICPGWPAWGRAIPEYLSRLTGLRTSCTRNRRSSRPLQTSSNRPSQRCLATKLLFSMKGSMFSVRILRENIIKNIYRRGGGVWILGR